MTDIFKYFSNWKFIILADFKNKSTNQLNFFTNILKQIH